MSAKTPDEILDKLPKKTPTWAVGIAVIIISISTSFLSIYIFSKEDIQQVVRWAEGQQERITSVEMTSYNDTLGRVLALVDINSNQIIELSKMLGTTQHQNQILNERVDGLEKKINSLTRDLNDCEFVKKDCLLKLKGK